MFRKDLGFRDEALDPKPERSQRMGLGFRDEALKPRKGLPP
jgi:hypothetical protein